MILSISTSTIRVYSLPTIHFSSHEATPVAAAFLFRGTLYTKITITLVDTFTDQRNALLQILKLLSQKCPPIIIIIFVFVDLRIGRI